MNFPITKLAAAVFLTASSFPFITKASSSSTLSNQTVSFKENKGQVSDQHCQPRKDILFSGTDGQLNYHLKSAGISYQLTKVISLAGRPDRNNFYTGKEEKQQASQFSIYRLDINWLNANQHAVIQKGEALAGYDNYYSASCPDGALNVKSYVNVTYKQIYNGIDLKWYEKEGRLKYDYVVSAGADHQLIQLEFDGAESLSINLNGELIIKTPFGDIIENAPFVKQGDKILPSAWKIINNIVSFEIKNIDHALPFTIDPLVRVWGTYYGGNSTEDGLSCVVDNDKNVFISGYTDSGAGTVIATSGSHQSTFNSGTDGYVVKFDANGIRQWGTYYGGGGNDEFYSSSVDKNGNIYAVGHTEAGSNTGIASPGAFQTAYGGGQNDGFIVKFNTNGVRQWGSYFGGSGFDQSKGCAVDKDGNVYMSGMTVSGSGIATSGVFQPVFAGGFLDAFLVKFDSSGTRLWGTYYGGNSYDQSWGCSTDTVNNCVYMTGHSPSTDSISIATSGAQQTSYGGDLFDAFLVKFDANGARVWGTYYGGSGEDYGYSCPVDKFGNVYLYGRTTSSVNINISSAGSHQSTYGGGNNDAFLAKFDANGVRQWGTYYGGNDYENGSSACSDNLGNIYITGGTRSGNANSIATPGSYQSAIGGISDGFLAKFNDLGSRIWGTYYGGITNYDGSNTCAFDGVDNVYMAGSTSCTETAVFTTPGAHQSIYGGGQADVFLVKFNDQLVSGVNEFKTTTNSSLTIFPNPNTGTFTIKANEDFELTIINELGQTMKVIHLNRFNNYELSVDDLNTGIYFIHGSGEKTSQSAKIIVIK